MIPLTIIALSGFIGSIAGIGVLIGRHWRDEHIQENEQNNPLFLEHLLAKAKERSARFWHTNLRHHCFAWFEYTLALLESGFKRIAAFLRLVRSKTRQRQLNGANGNGEDKYWHHLNSWNTRRLNLRLRRKKSVEENS